METQQKSSVGKAATCEARIVRKIKKPTPVAPIGVRHGILLFGRKRDAARPGLITWGAVDLVLQDIDVDHVAIYVNFGILPNQLPGFLSEFFRLISFHLTVTAIQILYFDPIVG